MFKVFKNNIFTVVKVFATVEEAKEYAAKLNRLTAVSAGEDIYFTAYWSKEL